MILSAQLELAAQPAPLPLGDLSVDLRGFTYDDRNIVLPALLNAMSSCGGWIVDRQPIRGSRTEFCFEVQLHAAMDMYSALIGAGLELTRHGHLDLTSLCMLRLHNPRPRQIDPVVTVRLEVSFLDEDEESLPAMAGKAAVA